MRGRGFPGRMLVCNDRPRSVNFGEVAGDDRLRGTPQEHPDARRRASLVPWPSRIAGVHAMNPEEAVQRQIERYRAMSGEQRLKIALDLHEFACNVAREGIRRQHPTATADEVEQLLRRRIELSRQ